MKDVLRIDMLGFILFLPKLKVFLVFIEKTLYKFSHCKFSILNLN